MPRTPSCRRSGLGRLSSVTAAVSATRGSGPSQRRRQAPRRVAPEAPKPRGTRAQAAPPWQRRPGCVRPAEAAPWPAHPRAPAPPQPGRLSPARVVYRSRRVARTSLDRTGQAAGEWKSQSSLPTAPREINRRPPAFRLAGGSEAPGADAERQSGGGHDPAPAFSRCCHVRWSRPGSGLPAPAGARAELSGFGCQRRGRRGPGDACPAPPRAARHWPPRAPPAPPGPGCALRPGQHSRGSSPAPPRSPPASLISAFFTLRHLFHPILASSQTPPRTSQSRVYRGRARPLGDHSVPWKRAEGAGAPRGRPGEAVGCEQRVITTSAPGTTPDKLSSHAPLIPTPTLRL